MVPMASRTRSSRSFGQRPIRIRTSWVSVATPGSARMRSSAKYSDSADVMAVRTGRVTGGASERNAASGSMNAATTSTTDAWGGSAAYKRSLSSVEVKVRRSSEQSSKLGAHACRGCRLPAFDRRRRHRRPVAGCTEAWHPGLHERTGVRPQRWCGWERWRGWAANTSRTPPPPRSRVPWRGDAHCVRPEQLGKPVGWIDELRRLHARGVSGPVTVDGGRPRGGPGVGRFARFVRW